MYRSQYRILGQIGQGQFGRVFCAIHRQTGEIVALKDLAIKGFSTKNFLRELTYLFTLQHPNIVSCKGLIYHPQGRYVVMDYCEGGTLRELIESDSQLSLVQKLKIIEDILSGLAYAHSRGVVHCDIKPENILLNITHTGWLARVSDFGIARLLEETSNNQSGGYTGSPAYMAPERFYGKHSYTSDIYAVGIILFEILVGKRPFSGYPGELMTAHLSKIVTIPEQIPPPLSSIIEKALRKLPQRRFSSAEEMFKSVRLARQQLFPDSSPLYLFERDDNTLATQIFKPIKCCNTSAKIDKINLTEESIYLVTKNKIICYNYGDLNFVQKPIKQWEINLNGSLIDLYYSSQKWLAITQLSDVNYQIQIGNKIGKNCQYTVEKSKIFCQCVSPDKHWLAIATLQNNYYLNLFNLSNFKPFKKLCFKSRIDEIFFLDNKHGIVIYRDKQYQTNIVFFNRKGWGSEVLSIQTKIHSLTPNVYFPYTILGIESEENSSAILIKLKPLKITRIPLAIKPKFIQGTKWGYVLVDVQGQILMINQKGKRIGKMQLLEEKTGITVDDGHNTGTESVTAVAPWGESGLLIATSLGEQGKLYLLKNCGLGEKP